MEDFAMFEEVSCEEFYGEDLWSAFVEGMEQEANFQLQEIADEAAAQAVDCEWEELIGAQFLSSEFESSHVEA